MERNETGKRRIENDPTPVQTLLVVDDDDEIRELLCEYLSDSGYRVLAAADGSQMWQVLEQQPVHLLILDLMLPGEDGLALCRTLQSRAGPKVIMLSARGTALDRTVGLEVGADDYLGKPFEPRELLARVKAVLRRGAPPPSSGAGLGRIEDPRAADFAGCRLDHLRRTLILPEAEAVALPRSDYRILCELLQAQERVLSREHLTRCAFDRAHLPDDRSVDMCISRLRQYLRPVEQHVHILTVRNEGYLLSCRTRSST